MERSEAKYFTVAKLKWLSPHAERMRLAVRPRGEAVEDMMTKNAVTEPEVEEDDYDRRDPTASAAVLGLGDGMSRLKGTEPEAPAPKKRGRKVTNGKSVGRNKPVSQVEAEWAARKVDDIPKLKALRAAGWTVKDLADEFHCTETTVAETMAREGIA